MDSFSSNLGWDRKDDPLSNFGEDTYSSTIRNRPLSNVSLDSNRNRLNTSTAYSENRNSSTFLDSFLNEEQPPLGGIGDVSTSGRKTVKFDESTIQTSRKPTNIDWLGLGNEEETNLAITSSDRIGDDDDWLTSGLSRRKKKSNQINTTVDNDTNLTTSIGVIKNEDTNEKIDKSNLLHKTEDKIPIQTNGELTILKTKVSVLEIEKLHLTESIDKLNANHEQEIKLLKQLHEVKDERDRRILDLKNQLDTMQIYLDENRARTNERIKELEKEWFNEIQRLKSIHDATVRRLIEQHDQEIETLQNFKTKFSNLDELLVKWLENSEKMESIHHKLTIEQDKLLNQRLNDIDKKDRQIENIENKWSQLVNNLKFERENSDQIKNLFIRTVDDQKQFIEKEKAQLRDDRNEFENERKKFLDERRTIELELKKSRDLIDQNQIDQRKQDENLKLRETELNQQQIDLIKKEKEWKINYERENDKLVNQSKQLDKDQLKLANDLSELKRGQDQLTSERKLFENKKELFDKEKIKLENLAQSIMKRSEELEQLSETVNEDRKENERLYSESEKLKKEMDKKIEFLETNSIDFKRREIHLERQSEIVHQKWIELENEKATILCSLCSNSLSNQDEQNSHKLNEFINVIQSSDLYLDMNENDRSLIVWQLTGQEENAYLEEETEFLKNLR